MTPDRLTDAEIDELKARFIAVMRDPYARLVRALIDEVVQRRQIDHLAAEGLAIGCPHGGVHALYCAGCCAQFDPGRMALVHEQHCPFREHGRAT